MERESEKANFSEVLGAYQVSLVESLSRSSRQSLTNGVRSESLDARTGDNICFFCPPSANFLMMMCGWESTVSTIAIKGDLKCNVSVVGVKGV